MVPRAGVGTKGRHVKETLGSILTAHCHRYPRLQMADLYKLLHQASMGSEHAIVDPEGARAWLERELAALGTGPDEPLVDHISPDGRIARVHLRPYVAKSLDPEALLAAFLRTGRGFPGEAERLRQYGRVAEEIASASRLPFPPGSIAAFMERMAHRGFPAVHHSAAYRVAYRPAYRVVDMEYLEIDGTQAVQTPGWVAGVTEGEGLT
jgi:hypothetical protein